MEYISNSDIETRKISEQFASHLKGGEVLCLYGDLGAGKTAFVQGMVNYFLPGKRVLSPTFIIVRHYLTSHATIKNIYHIDLYRLDDLFTIRDLGIMELFNKPDNVIAIEWPEKMRKLLPKKRIDIDFQIISDNQRKLSMLPCIDTW